MSLVVSAGQGDIQMGPKEPEAARRELMEELGVEVTGVGAVELSVKDPGSDFVIELLPVTIRGGPGSFLDGFDEPMADSVPCTQTRPADHQDS